MSYGGNCVQGDYPVGTAVVESGFSVMIGMSMGTEEINRRLTV